MIGTIKMTHDRGFGFLTADGRDYFFHRDDCANQEVFFNLRPGVPVGFDPATPEPSKGPRARNVEPIISADLRLEEVS